MPKRGGGSSSDGRETRRVPAVTTRARRRRADAGEQTSQSVSTNPILGSAGAPPGVQVAALTLEHLMEAVGARDEMQALSFTPYQLPQTQPVTPYQPPLTPYQPPPTQYQSLQLPPTQQSAVGQSLSILPSKFNDTFAELVDKSASG